MLVDFTVSNFRSIKDPVTLSAVASSIPSDDAISPPTAIQNWDLSLLNVLGIFGANASGKTNALRALDDCLLCMRFHRDFQLERRIPFLLNEQYRAQPTSYELRVALDANVFTFKIVFDSIRVLEESLVFIPAETKRENSLYSRRFDASSEQYVWENGQTFKGAHLALQGALKHDQTYIGLLIESMDVPFLRPLAKWLTLHFPGVNLFVLGGEASFLNRYLAKDPGMLQKVINLLRTFDTGIDGLEVAKNPNGPEGEFLVVAQHQIQGKSYRWPLEEESIGNQRLYFLAAKIIRTLEWGGCLLIDELGGNLHPNLAVHIMQLFQNPKTNVGQGQLIFSSHDNVLMGRKLMRRDQIWFTKRSREKSTVLYPLTDYSVRNDLAVNKAYLDGRFEAVPILDDDEDLNFLENRRSV